VLAAARRALPESEIRDEMELARGAPLAFNSGSAYALEGLADLSEGKATLTDATLAVSGTAADALTYARVRTAFPSTVPASITLGSVDVLPPRADPFVWSAEFDGESVAIVGYVPSEVVHQTLLATVRATLPGVRIEDGMALASGEPIGFAEAATFAVGAMARLSRGGVTLDGLALDVSGNAKSVDDHEALLASLRGPFPVGMSVVAAAVLPAPVSPYGWEGQRTNGKVVLSGYVPNAAMRDELHATALALFAEGEIDDRIRVAAGEPRMDWIGAIKFAMGELTRLSEGRVAIGDQTYTIEGEARTAEDYLALVATNEKTLPASLTLAAAEILPPAASPYVFTAEKSGGRVVVGGFVPDEASRESIFAAVHRKFGRVDVVGDLTFASGAPDGYANAAATALQMLSRLAGGRVEIADTNVKLDGFAYRGGLTEGFETSDDLALPDGFSLVEANVSERQGGQSVSAERCSELLQAALPSGNIEFDGTDPEILPDSFGFLDRIAATVARCPDVPVEVGAHTDSEGSASRNRDRTLARAEAIVDYLADAGVRRERMTAVGYGEDNPVADNDTDAGKAANRRIEFSLELPSPG
jgi:outer membrane protein OmpA-like peptidoglycan-associated protein